MRGRVLAHHLIWTGYGHWLPNDPRGSGSQGIANDELTDLGSVHFGRKPIQPPRQDVNDFYQHADELLEHPRIRFTEEMISVIADAFAHTMTTRNYTCYACAILPDHVHLVIRAHRDTAETMIIELQRVSRLSLERSEFLPPDHPVWIDGWWKVFLFSVPDIWSRVKYVENNPIKEGLPAQSWPFVTTYEGWPYRTT